MLCPPGYNIICQDRNLGRGSVLVLYRDFLAVHSLSCPQMIENAECVAIDVFTKTNLKLRFVCVYMSPTAASNAKIVTSICTILHNYLQVCYPVYIVGGFNLPYINSNMPSSYGGKKLQHICKLLYSQFFDSVNN